MLSTVVLAVTLIVLSGTLLWMSSRDFGLLPSQRQAYTGSGLVVLLLSLSLAVDVASAGGWTSPFGWAPLREGLRLAAAVLCVSATSGVTVLARHYNQLREATATVRAAETRAREAEEESLRQQLKVANRGWAEATHRLTSAALASRRLATSLEDETAEVIQKRGARTAGYDSDRVRSLADLELPTVPEHRTINGWFRTLSMAEDVIAWVYDSQGQIIRAAGAGCELWFGVEATDTIGTNLFDWSEPHHLESFRSLQQDPTKKITLVQNLGHYPNAGSWLITYQAVLTDGAFDGVLVVSLRLPDECTGCTAGQQRYVQPRKVL